MLNYFLDMIGRHQIDISKKGDPIFSKSRIERSLSKLERNPSINLSPAIDRCLSMARSVILDGGPCNLLEYALVTYTSLQFVRFNQHRKDKGSALILVGDFEFEVLGLGERYLNFHYELFYYRSILLLIPEASTFYQRGEIQPEDIIHESDYFWSAANDFLYGVSNYREDLIFEAKKKLHEVADSGITYRITKEGMTEVTNPEAQELFRSWLPLFTLYEHAYHKRITLFNDELVNYLLGKREFIERNGLLDDQRYWVDFPLLGCCAYAVDQGVEITVETEYAPRWVYERIRKD